MDSLKVTRHYRVVGVDDRKPNVWSFSSLTEKRNRGLGGFQAIREKAREIRDTNTTIIAIGIGGNIKYDLLKNLTGGDGNVFTSTTFNDKKLFELASNAMNQQQCQSKFLSLVFFLYKYFFIFKFSIWVYKQGLL